MSIPDSKPVQAASTSPSSHLIGLITGSATSRVSVMVSKKKATLASEPVEGNEFKATITPRGHGEMPKLESAATRLSGVEHELEENLESPSASLSECIYTKLAISKL